MANKVKRASNFTDEEVELLLNAVKKYAGILECKKSNTLDWKKKKGIWEKIESEFNSESSHAYRDADCLKKKYDNLKKLTKKKFADQKCSMLATGGGPPATVVTDFVDEELLDILNTQVTGLPAAFDSDAVQHLDSEIDEVVAGEEVVAPGTSQWKDYSPELLKTRKSKPLQVKNISNKSVNEEWCLLATTKTSILNELKQQAAERWSIEKAFLIEEQEMKRQKLSIEIEDAKLRKQCTEKELILLNMKINDAKNKT